jgi:integrase
MHTLNVDQVRALLEAAPEWDRCFYRLAASTGMRRGELLALQWSDVDLETLRPQLRVVRTLLDVGRGATPVYGEPKTERSRRRIDLSGSLAAALRDQRALIKETRVRAANVWRNHELVFPTRVGTPKRGLNVTRDLRQALEKAQLPPIRFHDLRHTAASLMLANNEHPRVVADMLGHADVGITLNLYSHSTPTLMRDAAERMAELLGG